MKKSVRQEITEYLTNFPDGVQISSITMAVKRPAQQITTALWFMKRKGTVTHDPDTHIYKLTPVNKSEQPAVEVQPAKAKPKAKAKKRTYTMTDRVVVAERDNRYLKERVEDLTARMSKLNVQYEDALAIVRYLEEKLFKAIQFNARHGNT